MKIPIALLLSLVFISDSPVSAQKDPNVLSIVFKNKVGNDSIEQGKTYYNAFKEPFTVARFKYYISDIALGSDDKTTSNAKPGYYLINEEDPASSVVEIKAQPGSYSAFSFTIGVDSIKNVSGTQTDALDPMNGMFWTWNSGYIMAKLEGTSSLSKAPGNLIEYHIGGFRNGQNTVHKITLPFPAGPVIIGPGKRQAKIVVEADINKWFNGQHDLKIMDQQACTTPGALATRYADNYAHMFRIVSVDE